jgi:prepilin-type N-terminal cleavage/methylation domain-containing protein/prepilin-type processing-associated H-X9-DG protein
MTTQAPRAYIRRRKYSPHLRRIRWALFACGKSRVHAFTLIELLVTISIIAVLVAFLVPALGRAKQAGYSTICRNNLRQISIAISLYANDTTVFPAFEAVKETKFYTWVDAVEPYLKDVWPTTDWPEYDAIPDDTPRKGGIFACPSYEKVPAYYRKSKYGHQSGAYGYNCGNIAHRPFGPGGTRENTGFPTGYNLNQIEFNQVRESSVVHPSNLFVVGDTILIYLRPGKNEFAGMDMIDQGSYYQDYAFHPSREAMTKRHGGKFIVSFADAHVETLKTNQMFYPSTEVLKRWNVDDLPLGYSP